MKIALLALFFLLLTLTKADYVYDSQGEKLSKSHLYYIAIGDELGRAYFTLPNVGAQSCPLPLMAAPITEHSHPLPVKFSDHNVDPYAFTDTPLNFTFVGIPLCSPKSKWHASYLLGSNSWSLLFGDGSEGLTVKGYFKIQIYGENYTYKILYCESLGSHLETCRNLSLEDHYLYLPDANIQPFGIRFEKVGSGISMVV